MPSIPRPSPGQGWDLKKDHFYHGLRPYLHDTLSFAMVELPEREQTRPTFDTLYTLAKKLEVGQLVHACWYTPSSEVYRDKHRCYVMPTGWMAAFRGRRVNTVQPGHREGLRV